jgi:hypothetical protein
MDLNDNYDFTLDIDDSLVKLNQYSLIEPYESFPLLDSISKLPALPIPCGCGGAVLPAVDKFQIRGDTLIYDDSIANDCYAFIPIKLIKANPANCKWKHAITRHEVSLMNFDSAKSKIVDLDSLRKTSTIVNILIGYTIYEEFGDLPKIQAADTFIEPSDTPRLISEVKDRYKGVKPIVVCLAIDSSVPESYSKKLFEAIPKDEVNAIYQMVTYDRGTKWGYEKIDNNW